MCYANECRDKGILSSDVGNEDDLDGVGGGGGGKVCGEF